MAYENDIYTRNEDSELAVRVVTATEGTNNSSYDDVFTRDTNGKLAVRVVGAGGGDSHNLGYFATPQALSEAYPTGEEGDYAIVGSTDTVWIWDSGTSAWVDTDTKGQVESVNGQTGAVTLGINDVAPTQTGKSGYVLGTDGFVAGWVKPEIIQVSAMPVASEDEVDNIYQYVGITDANYTNGYFYKCVSDGQTPVNYSWVRVDVQPQGDSLPSQTGQSGKFLTTDGTAASWSDKPLVNKGTESDSIVILGTSGGSQGNIIGYRSSVSTGSNAIGYNCSLGQLSNGMGYEVKAGDYAVAIGTSSVANNYSVTIGYHAGALYTTSNATFGIAIGHNALLGNNTVNAIQLGPDINSESRTFKVAFVETTNPWSVVNYKLLDADGTIPEARLADTTNAQQGDVLTLDSNGNAVWQAGGGGGGSVPTLTWYSVSTAGNTLTIVDTSSAQLVKVYKNGLLLQPTDDYTISGTTLTTVAALAVGDKITTEVF